MLKPQTNVVPKGRSKVATARSISTGSIRSKPDERKMPPLGKKTTAPTNEKPSRARSRSVTSRPAAGTSTDRASREPPDVSVSTARGSLKGTQSKVSASATASASSQPTGRKRTTTGAQPEGLDDTAVAAGSRRLTAKLSTRASSTSSDQPSHRAAALSAMGGVKIEVFARIRPSNEAESEQDHVVFAGPAPTTCHYEGLDKLDKVFRGDQTFEFDQVFGPDSSQQELYTNIVKPIVEQVALGTNCCLFAYGQTGTGKTHTMRGSLESGTHAGMIQRGVADLLVTLDREQYDLVEISVSYLEIYNERLEDLIEPIKAARYGEAPTRRLTLIEDEHNGNRVDGLTEVPIESAEEVMQVLRRGDQNARVAETAMNKMSNRAHRIFRITAKYDMHDCGHTTSMTFVDLAGSEDISKSLVTGKQAAETKHINKSLFALSRVIDTLAANEKHIPYRDSKLTQLLSDALGGMCQTTFIACISPVMSSFRESNSTLRYASRAMQALTISQQPPWKQDKIMLEGLTRKVVSLTAHIEEQGLNHRKKTMAMKLENKKMLDAQVALRKQLAALPDTVQTLLREQREDFHARLEQVKLAADERIRTMEDAIRRANNHQQRESVAMDAVRTGFVASDADAVTQMRGLAMGVHSVTTCHTQSSLRQVDELNQSEKELGRSLHATSEVLKEETATYIGAATGVVRSAAAESMALVDATSVHVDEGVATFYTAITSQAKDRANAVATTSAIVTSSVADVKNHTASATTLVTSTIASSDTYVTSTITRDTKAVAVLPTYGYPTSFAITPNPAVVLASMAPEWTAEGAIVDGSRDAGEGSDYLGSLGSVDKGGLVAETHGPARASSVAQSIAAAATESDAEDYDTDSEPVFESPDRDALADDAESESESEPEPEPEPESAPEVAKDDAATPASRLKRSSTHTLDRTGPEALPSYTEPQLTANPHTANAPKAIPVLIANNSNAVQSSVSAKAPTKIPARTSASKLPRFSSRS